MFNSLLKIYNLFFRDICTIKERKFANRLLAVFNSKFIKKLFRRKLFLAENV